MTYQEMIAQAKEAKKAKKLGTEIVKLKTAGDKIVGLYVSKKLLTQKKKMEPAFSYTFETDTGRVETVFGGAFDKTIGEQLIEGNIYEIVFTGQKQLDGNRRVNIFDVITLEYVVEQG